MLRFWVIPAAYLKQEFNQTLAKHLLHTMSWQYIERYILSAVWILRTFQCKRLMHLVFFFKWFRWSLVSKAPISNYCSWRHETASIWSQHFTVTRMQLSKGSKMRGNLISKSHQSFRLKTGTEWSIWNEIRHYLIRTWQTFPHCNPTWDWMLVSHTMGQ